MPDLYRACCRRLPHGSRLLLILPLLLLILPVRAEVVFKGLSRTTEKVVRATVVLTGESCSAPDARVRRLYRRADAEIRQALEVYGYYAPTIGKSLGREGDCWQATFTVKRGPRVKIRSMKVSVSGPGADDPVLSGREAQPDFAVGDGLNQRAYDAYKVSLAGLARRRGYFDGRFAKSAIDVYPGKLAADIRIDYASGERYRFGPVEFDQTVVEPELAARFVEFREGEPYDADQINDLYTALLASGYFQGVEVRTTPRPGPEPDVLVTVALTAAKSRTWTTGVGYATDTGAKFRLDYRNQRLNDKGHQFEFNSQFSEVLGGGAVSYRLPDGRRRDEWFSINAGYKYDNPEDSRSNEFRFGLQQTRRRGVIWRETRFIDYIHENYRIGEERGTSDLIVPGISWAEQPLLLTGRPRYGRRLNLKLSGTDEWLGSDTAFMQVETGAKLILPLGSNARLLTRLEAGWTIKDDFSDLPFSVRYFVGGDGSVRGYDYKSLGPVDADNNVTGGANKLVGSLEFDARLFGNWSAAVFVDSGNAFNSFSDMSLKTSVGAGIRWYSPLGPVRFDVGVPLDSDAPDAYRIHISLGPDL
ncbi:MAG: autotransporter assembly complex protein TamA [Gammaproteobacteria bacterium]|nr:autotransporter assembly complex protein TamA [Gammaproteobacteria bacterium]